MKLTLELTDAQVIALSELLRVHYIDYVNHPMNDYARRILMARRTLDLSMEQGAAVIEPLAGQQAEKELP